MVTHELFSSCLVAARCDVDRTDDDKRTTGRTAGLTSTYEGIGRTRAQSEDDDGTDTAGRTDTDDGRTDRGRRYGADDRRTDGQRTTTGEIRQHGRTAVGATVGADDGADVGLDVGAAAGAADGPCVTVLTNSSYYWMRKRNVYEKLKK